MNLVAVGPQLARSPSDVTLWHVSFRWLIKNVNEQFTSQSKRKEIEVALVWDL